MVKDVKELPRVVKESFHLATTGRPGPVLIDLPKDVCQEKTDLKYPKVSQLRGYRPVLDGHPEKISEAAAAITGARRPVICAGGGAISSGSSEVLRQLAELCAIPVTTTLMGKGVFPENHPLSLGMLGMHGTKMCIRDSFKAMGYTDEELYRPLIGIVNAHNEIVPGHIHLDTIARAVKDGVRMAGGTPVEFPVIGVCDGIAMNHEGMKYSLASRELIADSIEIMAMAHAFDGLVMIPNCDKIIPGMLMAAARLNLPAIFISGGPMMAGTFQGRKAALSDIFEGIGAVKAGKMTEADLKEMETTICPGCGSCAGMFTANSMNCLTEVMGLALSLIHI